MRREAIFYQTTPNGTAFTSIPPTTAMNLLDQSHGSLIERQPLEAEAPAAHGIRNFLFLIPENVPERERSVVIAAARRMTEHGYVYLAEGGRKDAEDCDEVRHLPLNIEHLPAFGLTTTVVVLHREDLAQKALDTYPDAQVFLLHEGTSTSAESDSSASSAEHYFSHLRPWLVTGQMAAIRH